MATLTAGLTLTAGSWTYGGDGQPASSAGPIKRVSAEYYEQDSANATSNHVGSATASDERSFYPREGRMRYAAGRMNVMQDPVPPTPDQPAQQFTSTAPVRTASVFGDVQISQTEIAADLPASTQNQIAVGAPNDFVVNGAETAFVLNTRDAGSLLNAAPSTTNVSLFNRYSITDPHIRGFTQRQFLVSMDGGQWAPRSDGLGHDR